MKRISLVISCDSDFSVSTKQISSSKTELEIIFSNIRKRLRIRDGDFDNVSDNVFFNIPDNVTADISGNVPVDISVDVSSNSINNSIGGVADGDKFNVPDGVSLNSEEIEIWQQEIKNHLNCENLPFLSLEKAGLKSRHEKAIIKNAIRTCGKFKVNSHDFNKRYKIVFPFFAPPGEGFLRLPYCSCKAYYYKSFDKKNKLGLRGCCKHLKEVLEYVGVPMGEFDWNQRLGIDPWKIKSD